MTELPSGASRRDGSLSRHRPRPAHAPCATGRLVRWPPRDRSFEGHRQSVDLHGIPHLRGPSSRGGSSAATRGPLSRPDRGRRSSASSRPWSDRLDHPVAHRTLLLDRVRSPVRPHHQHGAHESRDRRVAQSRPRGARVVLSVPPGRRWRPASVGRVAAMDRGSPLRRGIDRMMVALARRGMAPGGVLSLTVVGRTSGAERTVPVTPVVVDGREYLVAPYGHVGWVHNLRAARDGHDSPRSSGRAHRGGGVGRGHCGTHPQAVPARERDGAPAGCRGGGRPVVGIRGRSRPVSRVPHPPGGLSDLILRRAPKLQRTIDTGLRSRPQA